MTDFSSYQALAASIPGSGHIRRALPCQDASLAILTPRPALIVCDGRGSAQRSHDGAHAAIAAFSSQIAVFEPMLAATLDVPDDKSSTWLQFARIIYRTLMQVKLDLAARHSLPEREFDFTVAFAIAGNHHIGCFQVGDGAIVLRQNNACLTAFLPDKGEFANQTQFLREHGETHGHFQAQLFPAADNSGIAITSDGPEHLMFALPNMTPGPIFDALFDRLQNAELIQQDILDYLTRREWNNDPRGTDDRSLAIMVPAAHVAPATGKTAPAAPTTGQTAPTTGQTAPDAPTTSKTAPTTRQAAPATGKTAPAAPTTIVTPHDDTIPATPADQSADAARHPSADTPAKQSDTTASAQNTDRHHPSCLSPIIVWGRRTGCLIKRFSVLELLTTLILLVNTWLLWNHSLTTTPQPDTADAPVSTPTPTTSQPHLSAQPTSDHVQTTNTQPAHPKPTAPAKDEPAQPKPTAQAKDRPAQPKHADPATARPAQPKPTAPATARPTQPKPTAPATDEPGQSAQSIKPAQDQATEPAKRNQPQPPPQTTPTPANQE